MMNHWLHGMFTELVTPFARGGLDLSALERLVAWQIAQGAHGVVVATAVGEAPTLSRVERLALLQATREVTGPRYPVIAAVGSNDNAATVDEVGEATAAGASALLLRLPYYSRPTEAGLVAHIRAAARATSLEIVLDHDPGHCAAGLSPQALAAFGDLPNIVGLLDRTGDLRRCDAVMRARDRRFLCLTGAADSIPAYLLTGGCGAVTGIGNVAPQLLARMFSAARSQFHDQAQILQRRLLPLLALLAGEAEPAALKLALSLQHRDLDSACRLPITPARIAREELAALLEGLPAPPAADLRTTCAAAA